MRNYSVVIFFKLLPIVINLVMENSVFWNVLVLFWKVMDNK